MITMTEIARLTGVSQPTVSRVLNGNQAVNLEIRERVMACAKAHGYQPNVMAQSLAGSKTHLIGVILTDISNAFFADLVKYLEQEAGKSGYSLILFNTNYDLSHEQEYLEVVQRYRVDGLIVVPVQERASEWKNRIQHLNIPTVVITRQAKGVDSVYVDHQEAGVQVGRHLYEEGYENYIFFGNTDDAKYCGFVRLLEERDSDFQEKLTIINTKDSKTIEKELKIHFEQHPEGTGIFAYNDRRALQMMGILNGMGIEVPGRAGLVGFDNTYMCEYLYPPLSSVSQPNEAMAVKAVELLLHKIEHPEDIHVEDWPMRAKLIPRESSLFRKKAAAD